MIGEMLGLAKCEGPPRDNPGRETLMRTRLMTTLTLVATMLGVSLATTLAHAAPDLKDPNKTQLRDRYRYRRQLQETRRRRGP